jgi:hypothetical protein
VVSGRRAGEAVVRLGASPSSSGCMAAGADGSGAALLAGLLRLPGWDAMGRALHGDVVAGGCFVSVAGWQNGDWGVCGVLPSCDPRGCDV